VLEQTTSDVGVVSLESNPDQAIEQFGREIFALLPNDYRTMVEVRNNGVPLIVQAPRTGITHAIRDLASKLEGVNQRIGKDGDAVAKGGESKWRKFWPGGKSS